MRKPRLDDSEIHVRPAERIDFPGIVQVCKSSMLPGEDTGFGGGGAPGPFQDTSKLALSWQEPYTVNGHQVLVAEQNYRIVGVSTIEDRGRELELVDIDVPLELQGRGIGTRIVRSIEEKARSQGKSAVTLGTSRNAQGIPWKSLPWWQHLGYRITHEEENDWTRSIGPGAREIRMRKDL